MDFLFAASLIVCLSWLLILIVLFYPLSGQRSILFTQMRTGLQGRPFRLYKFRTLHENDKLPLEKRRFRYGSFLRYTSLDELPQLWNILKGEMSFIGPRPLPVEYLSQFSDQEKQRLQVKPGITGLAQINGRHGITWKKKFEHDLYYIGHVSFWLDLKIAVKTIVLLLSFKKDISLQEEKFTGNA